MNLPARVATAAVIHVGRMFVAGLVFSAGIEAVQWFVIWNEARRNP